MSDDENAKSWTVQQLGTFFHAIGPARTTQVEAVLDKPRFGVMSEEDYVMGRAIELVDVVRREADREHAIRIVALLVSGGFRPRPKEAETCTCHCMACNGGRHCYIGECPDRRTNEASHASIGSGAGDDEGYIHPDVLASQSKEFQAEYELRGTRFAKSSGKKLGEGSTDDGPRLCDACGRDLDRESKAASDNAATARTDSPKAGSCQVGPELCAGCPYNDPAERPGSCEHPMDRRRGSPDSIWCAVCGSCWYDMSWHSPGAIKSVTLGEQRTEPAKALGESENEARETFAVFESVLVISGTSQGLVGEIRSRGELLPNGVRAWNVFVGGRERSIRSDFLRRVDPLGAIRSVSFPETDHSNCVFAWLSVRDELEALRDVASAAEAFVPYPARSSEERFDPRREKLLAALDKANLARLDREPKRSREEVLRDERKEIIDALPPGEGLLVSRVTRLVSEFESLRNAVRLGGAAYRAARVALGVDPNEVSEAALLHALRQVFIAAKAYRDRLREFDGASFSYSFGSSLDDAIATYTKIEPDDALRERLRAYVASLPRVDAKSESDE